MIDRCEYCGCRWGYGDLQWISVKDRLPKEHGYYLTLVKEKEAPEIVLFEGDIGIITHWLPTPIGVPEDE